MTKLAITVADITAAAQRLEGFAVETPLLEFPALNDRVGGRVLIKAENLQRTGSFKFRGAFNRLKALTEDEAARGVVAFSSGNHAQGVAHAAQILGIQATIVMPSDAPAIKLANTKAYGAAVVTYDRERQSREAIADEISAETGAIVVPSFNDPYIIAGQGTAGLEAARQMVARGLVPDMALFCCGGGGLSSGSFMALKAEFPDMAPYVVEPEHFDDTQRSLASGQRQHIEGGHRSICDALLSEAPGRLTFAILKSLGAEGLVVSDEDALSAVGFAANRLKLVAEPGGAVALAAVLHRKVDLAGKTALIVISGGNVDPDMLDRALRYV